MVKNETSLESIVFSNHYGMTRQGVWCGVVATISVILIITKDYLLHIYLQFP